uniref:electron transport complex subunit RsxC n=1 Tax=Rappaport israeli TaxID=1839807 RepID=UPI000A6D2902
MVDFTCLRTKPCPPQQPSSAPPLANTYTISLRQSDGNSQIPTVKVGNQVLKNQPISQPTNPYATPNHAPTSGIITAISPHSDPHPSNQPALHIHIQADGNDHSLPPLQALDYRQHTPETLLTRIQQCGIVGLGGAGFPTARKLSHPSPTLLINAAECEPYITCDDLQIREHSHAILQGAQISAHIIGAQRILIGIEDDKPQALKALQQSAQTLNLPHLEIHSLPTKYPSGNQRQLIELLLNLRIPNHAHASDYGIICHNSATIKAIYDAIACGQPLIERYISVTGEAIAQPQVFRARLGTPIDHLLTHAGGQIHPSRLIIGGPMMGYQLNHLQAGVQKTTNCLLLLPIAQSEQNSEQPCIRCAKCADACPMELLPQQLYWYSRNQQHQRLQQYRLFDCIECGICASVCPSSIPLVQYYRHSKGAIAQAKRKDTAAEIARARHEARQARLERQAAERKARMDAKRAQLQAKTAQQPQKHTPPTHQPPNTPTNNKPLKPPKHARKHAAKRVNKSKAT